RHWYIDLLDNLKLMYPNVLLVLFIIKTRTNKYIYKDVLIMALYLAIFVNLSISIPSVGNRFQMLLYPFIVLFWIGNQNMLKGYKYIVYLFPVIFIKDLFLLYSNTVQVVDPYFYVSPLFYFLYYTHHI